MPENIKSRIFLSCGQKTSKDNNEVEIASQISDKLTDIGFEVYMAIGKQSLKSIKENIFPKLEEAEYFLFIDFKREKLDTGEYRGSLFSNQELAVATFLDKEVLIFQEKGLKMRDGLLSSIQANSILFDDRTLLLKIIEDKIRELNWNLNWRNELVIKRELQDEYADATWRDNGKAARFYNLEIKNLHDKKIAFDCIAYLESVIDLNSGENKKFLPIEFKWSAINVPRVMIPPLYSRSLDAFYVNHETPNNITFSINQFLVDSDGVYDTYTLNGPGKFEVTFVIFSFNFSPVRETFVLEIGNLLEEIRFYKKGHELINI